MSDKRAPISKGKNSDSGAGYVYVASNQLMPGLVKVGRTEGLVNDRLRGLYTTGVPGPFQAERKRFFADCYDAEGVMHETLTKVGKRCPNREFFVIARTVAIDVLEDLYQNQHERTQPLFFELFIEEAFPRYLSKGDITSAEDTFEAIFGLPHEKREALKLRLLGCAMNENDESVAKWLISKKNVDPEVPIRYLVGGIKIPMYDLTAFEYSILWGLIDFENYLVRIGCDIRNSNALCFVIDVLINGPRHSDKKRIVHFAIELICRGANVHKRLNSDVFSRAMKNTASDTWLRLDVFPRSSNMSCYEIASRLAPENFYFATLYNAMTSSA